MSSPIDPSKAVREHLLQDDTSSDQKPNPAAEDREVQRNGEPANLEPAKLERYWLRTLVLILIPSIVTAWYGVVWVALVLGIENDETVKYRTFSGSLIFYSWFIIGVFGLSWAKYGLTGVEVAMLRTPFWRASNLVAFLMHSNSTWSNPSGWLKAIYHREFHRLWSLFAILSFLPFIAFPLSGLVFEISDGYIATSKHPMVVGRNQSNFNDVWPVGKGTSAEQAWAIGSTPTIPGFGVVYTRQGIDRSKHPGLKRMPNTLPLAEAIPDMFLAPQADVPVSGKAWGLRVKYDCSNVRSASEFTILSEKPESTIKSTVNDTNNPTFLLETPSGQWIDIFSTGITPPDGTNLWAYGEIGSNDRPGVSGNMIQYNESSPDFVPEDVSKSSVLEYAVWQIQFTSYYDEEYPDDLFFNRTLAPVVEGMGSPFSFSSSNLTMNSDFFKIRGDGDNFTVMADNEASEVVDDVKITDLRDIFDAERLISYHEGTLPALDVAGPIGVRCIVSSGLGTAALDGTTATFSDFERLDPEPSKAFGNGHSIFGHTAFNSLHEQFFELYQASHLPPKVSQSDMYRWQGYVHSQALQEAVMLAYGLDALQLMYELYPGPEGAWESVDLTSSREGKILTIASLIPGSGTGYFVLALFCLWSVLSAALGIVYGFRKRPSDKLGAYETLGLGVQLSGNLKHNDEFKSGQSFYNNKTFQALPGS